MSRRKGGWERAKELEKKKRHEAEELKKTHKLTSFFPVLEKDATGATATDDSPSISQVDRDGATATDDPLLLEEAPVGPAVEAGLAVTVEGRADTASVTIPNDVGLFGDITDHLREMCIGLGTSHFRNLADSYPETKRDYSGVNRFLNSSAFKRVLPNGEVASRDWLVYSPAKACVFCFPCILFSSDRVQLSGPGFTDWKNMAQYLKAHEISPKHVKSVLTLCQRSVAAGQVDEQLHRNMLEQRNYWKNVLARCVATITFLCERGLALRGSDEIVGSRDNGNYLGILELIGQFDPFLSQHIRTHANHGRGHTSYLSKTICEELIAMMGKRVIGLIKDEIAMSRYFSVSVDSTPDITHTDQLTIILRYVHMMDHQPVERFLTFINISSHTGQSLADTLLQYLLDQDINFENCRGQTYDNASNMSGKYTGMQRILKNKNSLVDYIPCAAHSLNLVGQSAVDCCVEAVSFFELLQRLYTFFAASTHRWGVLMTHVKEQPECLVPKHPSDTRWSARADATEAVFRGYHQFQSALREITGDATQNGSTRNEADGLAKHFDTIEVALMCELWNDILLRFNRSSKLLQSPTIELTPAIALLKSLDKFLDECREKFDYYEQKARDRCGSSTYKSESRRVPKRKKHVSDGDATDAVEGMSGQQKFKVNTFYVIIDQLKNALQKRIEAYSMVLQRFGVLTEYDSMSDEDIDVAISRLVGVYSKDLSSDFPAEFRQFICWYKEQRPDEIAPTGSAQVMFQMLHTTGVHHAFPNTELALRIYLSLMATNCSGERSFSQLKRIKDVKRSTMGQQRLGILALLCIESDLLHKIDFKKLTDEFAVTKARKVVI